MASTVEAVTDLSEVDGVNSSLRMWSPSHDDLHFMHCSLLRDCKQLSLAIEHIWKLGESVDKWMIEQISGYLILHLEFSHRQHNAVKDILIPFVVSKGLEVPETVLAGRHQLVTFFDLLEDASIILRASQEDFEFSHDSRKRALTTIKEIIPLYEDVLLLLFRFRTTSLYPSLSSTKWVGNNEYPVVSVHDYLTNVISRMSPHTNKAVFYPWLLSSTINQHAEIYLSNLTFYDRTMYSFKWKSAWDVSYGAYLPSIYDPEVPRPHLPADHSQCVIS